MARNYRPTNKLVKICKHMNTLNNSSFNPKIISIKKRKAESDSSEEYQTKKKKIDETVVIYVLISFR